MNWTPKTSLTEEEVRKGLVMVIGDGLAAEAMTTLTGGAFLVAMALLLGASNFQIGILAAMPTFTNIFQLLSIWLVGKYNNRRLVAVGCALLARIPLVLTGLMALTSHTSASTLMSLLFFYYFFGSIAGPSWNSWMKDLVPEASLGSYFARRTRLSQILNVVLSLVLAVLLDYVKRKYPSAELTTYAVFFILGGLIGIAGGFILSRAPEPRSSLSELHLLRLLRRPLMDGNFSRLLIFNAAWTFALNLATPFFTVYMIKAMGLPMSYIVGLTILGLVSSIFTIRTWGKLADRYSNKTIIAIGAPIYILCLIGWCFVGIYTREYANLTLLVLIHIVSGIATAGINLSLTNIGLKLAPKEDAIVYLSTQNIITAFFSSIAPILGGWLADFFTSRHLHITAQWTSPKFEKTFRLLMLHEWNFLFLIGAFCALIAIQLLAAVKETGEVEKDQVVRIMRSSIKSNLRDYFIIGNIITWHEQLRAMLRKRMLR
ncbi:MAG TPA: MFS transporter [Puia sp.]|nr:MFS transporter [Puia sp.]